MHRWISLLSILPVLAFSAPSYALVGEEVSKLKGLLCAPAMKGLELDAVRNRDAVFKYRIYAPWSRVEPYLIGDDLEEIARRLIADDKRADIFQAIEQWKFYIGKFEGTPYWPQLKKLIQRINDLEDVLGRAVDAGKLPAKMTEAGMAEETIAAAREEARDRFGELMQLLHDDQWTGPAPKTLRKLIEVVDRLPIPSQLEDAEYLEREIRKHLDEIQALVNDRDDIELEHFIHKLKSLLRKLSLLKQAALGKIRTIEWGELDELMKELQDLPETSLKYMRPGASPFEIKHYVFFDLYSEKGVAWYIGKLDVIKNNGEYELNAIRLGLKSGEFRKKDVAEREVRKRLRANVPGWFHWEDHAFGTVDSLDRSGILKRLLILRKSLPAPMLEYFESADYKSPI